MRHVLSGVIAIISTSSQSVLTRDNPQITRNLANLVKSSNRIEYHNRGHGNEIYNLIRSQNMGLGSPFANKARVMLIAMY